MKTDLTSSYAGNNVSCTLLKAMPLISAACRSDDLLNCILYLMGDKACTAETLLTPTAFINSLRSCGILLFLTKREGI